MNLTFPDLLGLAAALLVLATFSTGDFIRLRSLAIGSNIAFAAYGLMLGLWPVALLHGLLLPINIAQLRRRLRMRRAEGRVYPLPPPSRRVRDIREACVARPVRPTMSTRPELPRR